MNAKITIKNTHNGLDPRPKPNIKPDDKQVLTQFSCKKKQTGTKQKPNFYLPSATKLFKNRTSKSWLNIKKNRTHS